MGNEVEKKKKPKIELTFCCPMSTFFVSLLSVQKAIETGEKKWIALDCIIPSSEVAFFFLAPFVFFDAPYYYAHTTLRYVQAAVETNLV